MPLRAVLPCASPLRALLDAREQLTRHTHTHTSRSTSCFRVEDAIDFWRI